MSRRPALFTEADLFRAAKAAKRAGMVAVAQTDGTIRFVPDQPGEQKVLSAPVEVPPQPLC